MSVIVFLMEGYLQLDYALFIALWVVFGSIAGNLAADFASRKNGGKQTIIVWTLALVFLLSAVVTPFVAYE
jgi:cytochrome c oxidase assembly factor CtaG